MSQIQNQLRRETPAEEGTDERIERFLAGLRVPTSARNPVTGFAETADACREAVVQALFFRAQCVRSDPMCLHTLLEGTAARFEPALQAQLRRLPHAAPADVELRDRCDAIWRGLDQLMQIAQMPVLPPRSGHSVTSLSEGIATAIKHLKRFSYLVSTSPTPARPALREVWEALEGRRLSAKQLEAELPGRPSEDAVRQRIADLKKGGWETPNVNGYYRPDAPPLD